MALTDREKELLSSLMRDPQLMETAAKEVYDDLVDDAITALAFEIHWSIKTGLYCLTDPDNDDDSAANPSSKESGTMVDVFGQAVTTTSGVPALKKQCECVCPNCQRNLAASRFAPHLEKCMGMGRNSSRIASRRLANNNKESSGSGGGGEEAGEDEDEDWIEPGKTVPVTRRRQRDKNSPRRHKGPRGAPSFDYDSLPSGGHTPPLGYEAMTAEERSNVLSYICGVISSNSRKICMRSTKCPVHTVIQRKEIRMRWLSPEEDQVDIDSFTEGDTTALRESLAQLSNASSPAESTVSTSSNPSAGSSIRAGPSRRDKMARSKRGKSGFKGGSRGSTPPLPMME